LEVGRCYCRLGEEPVCGSKGHLYRGDFETGDCAASVSCFVQVFRETRNRMNPSSGVRQQEIHALDIARDSLFFIPLFRKRHCDNFRP
jgi:hypothetical protein